VAASAAKAAAREEIGAARLAVHAATTEVAAWVAAGPLTEADFMDYGRAAVQPGYDYFAKLFLAPDGEMRDIYMAYRAATLFDALKLRDMTETAALVLIDLLGNFNFPEITPAFVVGLQGELPLLLRHARRVFDWGAVDGAADYDATLARKRKLEEAKAAAAASSSSSSSSSSSAAAAAPELTAAPQRTEEGVFDWKQDPAERARRLWEWWVPRVGEFTFWSKALRLVALVQPSSAEVERLFSQLKLILEQISVSGLEECYEGRTMTRVNVY